MNKPIIPGSFVHDIKLIIGQARTQAVRSVEFYRVQMYWKLGERILKKNSREKNVPIMAPTLFRIWQMN